MIAPLSVADAPEPLETRIALVLKVVKAVAEAHGLDARLVVLKDRHGRDCSWRYADQDGAWSAGKERSEPLAIAERMTRKGPR